jgi:phenylalanyl-tRNA synthetase alpha chain
MEIFSFHKGLNKLVEIGNSGMFRPEMLESMGLPKDMRVFGWGLSLERPTMIKYKVCITESFPKTTLTFDR